jgi:pimeloyl-ACP methyl ester carboxylesterase
MRLFVREFDFRLADIRMPLALFHGEHDQNVPIGMVRKVVTGLPTARLVTYEHEGHLSTLCNHMDEVVRALVS